MHRFDYHTPATLPEAIALLDRFGNGARIIAGGTDLLTALKERWETPSAVVDLRCLSGLGDITLDEQALHIGARVTVREVETSPLVVGHFPALAYAASTLASIQIRNLATVAGNICRASPSADIPPVLLALGASVTAIGPGGERTVLLDKFFTGPGRTVLARNEILTAIHVPLPVNSNGTRSGAAYIKHSPRHAMDLAMVGVAVAVSVEWGALTAVRIALGAVAPTPMRSLRAEASLLGCKPAPELLVRAGEAAAGDCSPISDVRGSAAHRREIVAVQTRRALEQAIEQAGAAR